LRDTYTQRKDRPVLGKQRFDVTHHEPRLTDLERKERMRWIERELYSVFQSHTEKIEEDFEK